MRLNNTPPPDVTTVQITDERLTFGLEDGRIVSVPLSFYPTLQLATRRERADFEISHTSVYWPKLDCDISSRSEERRVGKEGRSRCAPHPSSRRRHTRCLSDWSSDVCSSDLLATRRERADFEISHTSVYWPKLDCDISS